MVSVLVSGLTMVSMNRPRKPLVAVTCYILAFSTFVLAASGCGSSGPVSSSPAETADVVSRPAGMITIGDIDPDEPAKKVARFQPLADYLARNLSTYDISEGRVRIARDINEMGALLKDGTVSIYMDSLFPTVSVQELSGSKIIARRWKAQVPTYWSTYVALRGSGIDEVSDFKGAVIAFEEPHSTSGFLLPAGTLVQRGLVLTEATAANEHVGQNEIGYVFSGDEENTFELIQRGDVAGGAVSNDDFAELPDEVKNIFVAFDRTVEVPRQLVSVAPGLDSALTGEVRRLLFGLDQSEEGRAILDGLKKTLKFDDLMDEDRARVDEFKDLIKLVKRESQLAP